MSFLNGDEVLAGLKRGAEKFGSSTAIKVVKKLAKRLNGFAPTEAEPYGLGALDPSATEQESSAAGFYPDKENDIPPARLRQQKKLDFLKADLPLVTEAAEKAEIELQIKRLEDELAGKDKVLSNEDSGNLGYQSAQKSTTAQDEELTNGEWRCAECTFSTWDAQDAKYHAKKMKHQVDPYDINKKNSAKSGDQPTTKTDELLQSQCPACGHKSEKAWNGQCESCLRKNEHDVAGRKNGYVGDDREPYAKEMGNDGEKTVKCVKCGDQMREGMVTKGQAPVCEECEEKQNDIYEPKKDDIVEEHIDYPHMPKECGMHGYIDDMEKNVHGAGYLCKGCAPEWNNSLEKSHAAENATSEYKVVKVTGGWEVVSPEGGKSGEIFEDLGEARDRARMLTKHGPERTNAGHLGPDAWEAAATEERAVWLELAGQDINLATSQWTDLSLDVHKMLEFVYDKPACVNNASEEETCKGCGVDLTKHDHRADCELANAAGRPGKKKFTFRDLAGEEETVEAEDLNKAWDMLANIFGEPAEALKKIGVKLVRENAEDPTGDVSEIERHVEGIEHELGELKHEENKKISKEEIGEEIAHHIKDKGMDPKQAEAAAYSESREHGSDLGLKGFENSGLKRGSEKYGAPKK